ncbi:MAG: ABC transporter substrate-binding protein [Deltaproteobacteria bacterium]|nr:ABC transporter substrate-binding protein [Deltaproteobacteria bacterium]
MKCHRLVALAILLPLMSPHSADAQKVYRISVLVSADAFVPAFEGFKKKMGELGYTEGKNIKYDFHNAKGDKKRLTTLAQKIVQDKPDVIATSSTTATVPVARMTKGTNIPVVFLSSGNPLKFVKSYASSGNNLTGISSAGIDVTEKRVELLKELAPWIEKVISLQNPEGVNYREHRKAMRRAAKKLGLELVEVNVTSSDELVRKADKIFTRELGDAVIHPPDAIINSGIRKTISHAIEARLPSVAANVGGVKAGALATYAADYYALGQQGAVLVDKILKGARPMDLPIEQPFKLRLVINLKTARAMGLDLPREILLRADEVIE